MRNRQNRGKFRIARIERKCDRILSELLILRQQLRMQDRLDRVFDRMHDEARIMRASAIAERDRYNSIFK